MIETSIYIVSVLLCVFALTGVNFNNFFKANHKWEARVFMVLISLALGYLVASFLITFMNVSQI